MHAMYTPLVDERRGNTRLAATAGTTDAMDIVLDLGRHVEVDDVLDVGEVHTLACNVGRYHHILLAVLEHPDGPVTLLLTCERGRKGDKGGG